MTPYLNVTVSGYSHVIEEDDVRHAWARHGPSGKADRSLTKEDFNRIPSIVLSPDEVRIGTTAGSIEYRKREGGNWLVIEEQRTGAKTLAFKTMRKEKGD